MHHRDRLQRRRSWHEPGQAHELTFSCYRRYPFLAAERTCRWLADAVERARQSRDFALWAFVFMPDHVHLIVQPRRPDADLGAILQAIKLPVGRKAIAYLEANAPEWLPRVSRQRGGKTERLFWQSGGGYERTIIEPRALRTMIDYIHLNPVRRGLVAQPADWRWSSAGWYEGQPGNDLHPDPIPPEWLDSVQG